MGSIKGILTEEMPRERLIKYGAEMLSEVELLAILLRVGTKEKNVIELSREIIQTFESNLLSRKTYFELIKIKGINKAKACQIVSVFELSRRLASKSKSKNEHKTISSSDDVYREVKIDFDNLKNEKVMVIFVNSKNKTIKKEFMFEGGLDYSIIDPRLIIKRVFSYEASGFFLIHNHPSGEVNPSKEDELITDRIKEICISLDIRFLDHLVIGDGYYSFFDNERM